MIKWAEGRPGGPQGISGARGSPWPRGALFLTMSAALGRRLHRPEQAQKFNLLSRLRRDDMATSTVHLCAFSYIYIYAYVYIYIHVYICPCEDMTGSKAL